METLEVLEKEQHDAAPTSAVDTSAGNGSRWRSVWRLHFYAGIFSMPFIVLMALTGLVILYSQPIHDLTQGDIRTVAPGQTLVSFDEQEKAVELAYPDVAVTGVTMPADRHHSTIFTLDDASKAGLEVMVNPYTGKVLGTNKPGSGKIGRAHV